MLTGKNIDAINEFIERWDAGERGFTGRHGAGERLLAKGLRELGVAIKSGHDLRAPKATRAKTQKRVEAKKRLSPEELRQRRSELQKALWADPAHRAKRLTAISKASKKAWANKETREKRLAAIRKATKTPAFRAASSQRMKAVWALAKATQMHAAE
jgi:hypothetical protein